jgi:hypothetical protein
MEYRKAKLLFLMLPFLVLIVVGGILVLFASTSFWEEGRGTVFYNPLGVPGILAIVVGVTGLFLLFITKWSP